MARLGDHPNIVTVYDAVEDALPLYIVACFMAGGSLAERLGAVPGGRLPAEEVLRTGRALADALAHAHAHGVVHRDVKPDNVWLAADGSAGLGDFGIALGGPRRPRPTGAARRDGHALLPGAGAGRGRAQPAPAVRPLRARRTLWELLLNLLAVHRPGRDRAARPAPQRLVGSPSRHAWARSALDELILALLRQARRPTGRPTPQTVRDALDRLGGAPSVPVVPLAADRDPLVGRDVELAAPARRLRGCPGGSAQVAAIAGEPGIGMTPWSTRRSPRRARAAPRWSGPRRRGGARLRALARRLRPLVTAASGLPAPVLDDVRRYHRRRPPARGARGRRGAPTREEQRLRIFDAVAEAVAPPRASSSCRALEDVHAADRSSLALLVHLLGAAPEARLLVVLTYRTAEAGAGHPLAGRARALERDRRLTRLELRGLPEASVGRFLLPRDRVAPATLRALHERTAGNPFCLRELVGCWPSEASSSARRGCRRAPRARARGRRAPARAARSRHPRGARDRRRRRPPVHDRRRRAHRRPGSRARRRQRSSRAGRPPRRAAP